jgi:hypothetical protein
MKLRNLIVLAVLLLSIAHAAVAEMVPLHEGWKVDESGKRVYPVDEDSTVALGAQFYIITSYLGYGRSMTSQNWKIEFDHDVIEQVDVCFLKQENWGMDEQVITYHFRAGIFKAVREGKALVQLFHNDKPVKSFTVEVVGKKV